MATAKTLPVSPSPAARALGEAQKRAIVEWTQSLPSDPPWPKELLTDTKGA